MSQLRVEEDNDSIKSKVDIRCRSELNISATQSWNSTADVRSIDWTMEHVFSSHVSESPSLSSSFLSSLVSPYHYYHIFFSHTSELENKGEKTGWKSGLIWSPLPFVLEARLGRVSIHEGSRTDWRRRGEGEERGELMWDWRRRGEEERDDYE